eukprot:1142657-Pelagomonas_calceolata.AAC.9
MQVYLKHRLGKANSDTGYYYYYQSVLPTVHKKIPSSTESTQWALKYPPAYNVPSVGSQTVPFTLSQDVNFPPCQIWQLSGTILLAESSLKVSAKALFGQAFPPWTLAAQIVKYCGGTRPKNLLEASKQQHRDLCCLCGGTSSGGGAGRVAVESRRRRVRASRSMADNTVVEWLQIHMSSASGFLRG